MNYILDTQAFIWLSNDNKKLSQRVRKTYLDTQNLIFLSSASMWEMAIKINLGKLNINDQLDSFIEKHVLGRDINILNIKPEHIYKLESLPLHHRDPFDRMIIAQGMSEGLRILSSDKAFDKYPIERIW